MAQELPGPVTDAAVPPGWGQTVPMERETAELSSVETQISDLTRRIVETAGVFKNGGRDDVAHELFEVERSLRAAARRLERAARAARS